MQNITNKKNKIGILGGTFDPPHIGHLYISEIALKKLKLNHVVWLITKQNPLKQKAYFNIKARINLAKIMLKNEKKISVEYIEKNIKSKNTYDSLNHIKKKYIKIKLFFLMGEDSLVNFHKWKKWKKIPQLAKIIVFNRTNYSIKARKSVAAKKLKKKDITYINNKRMDISSSLIRKF